MKNRIPRKLKKKYKKFYGSFYYKYVLSFDEMKKYYGDKLWWIYVIRVSNPSVFSLVDELIPITPLETKCDIRYIDYVYGDVSDNKSKVESPKFDLQQIVTIKTVKSDNVEINHNFKNEFVDNIHNKILFLD